MLTFSLSLISYNIRLPSDPSWPKVPLRRLNDDIDGVESPYVVTLTGTPRRNHIKQIITYIRNQERIKSMKPLS